MGLSGAHQASPQNTPLLPGAPPAPSLKPLPGTSRKPTDTLLSFPVQSGHTLSPEPASPPSGREMCTRCPYCTCPISDPESLACPIRLSSPLFVQSCSLRSRLIALETIPQALGLMVIRALTDACPVLITFPLYGRGFYPRAPASFSVPLISGQALAPQALRGFRPPAPKAWPTPASVYPSQQPWDSRTNAWLSLLPCRPCTGINISLFQFWIEK